MGKLRLRRFKLAASTASVILLAAISVPLFNWLPAEAANTITGNNTLASIDSSGSGGGNNHSSYPDISEDGNIVVFSSQATNLPATGSTSIAVPYIRNISAGTTVRADTSATGVLGDGITFASVMSRTGRYLILDSTASNLIDGTTITATQRQMYIKDTKTGEIERLSADMPSDPATAQLWPTAVSDDGRFVVFVTKYAAQYIPGIRTGYSDVIAFDRDKDTWTQIDAPASGSPQNVDTNSISYSGASCDGSLVMLYSAATNLVPSHSGSGRHIFIADLRYGVKLVDITAGATSDSYAPSMSCNGRYITFWTFDRTFVSPTPSGMDANAHLVRYDRITGDRQYVDSNSSNAFAPGITSPANLPSSVSDKGDVMVTYKTSTGLGSYATYVYLKHLSDGSGTLERILKNPTTGTYYYYDEQNVNTRLSADGKYIVMRTKKIYDLGLTTNTDQTLENIVRTSTGL